MTAIEAIVSTLVFAALIVVLAHKAHPVICARCGRKTMRIATRRLEPATLQVQTCPSCGLHRHRKLYPGESRWSDWFEMKSEPP